jgi:hypothetical protein
MAVKLSVGLQKKIGLRNYGSLGASCYVEFEIESSLLFDDPAGFQQKVRSAYRTCREAVAEELAHHQVSRTAANGHAHGHGSQSTAPRRATASQIHALQSIAECHGIDLAALLQQRFQVAQTAELLITQASDLITELKSAAPGTGDFS